MHSRVRKAAAWSIRALLAGVLLMPVLVYLTGVEMLGPYSGGSLWRFIGAFFRDLARFEWQTWMLAVAPVMLLAMIWLVRELFRRWGRMAPSEDEYEDPQSPRSPTAPARREPAP